MGLLISVRTVKAGAKVCIAGDLCLVRSQLSSCVAGRVAVIIASILSSLVHRLWYLGGCGGRRAMRKSYEGPSNESTRQAHTVL